MQRFTGTALDHKVATGLALFELHCDVGLRMIVQVLAQDAE